MFRRGMACRGLHPLVAHLLVLPVLCLVVHAIRDDEVSPRRKDALSSSELGRSYGYRKTITFIRHAQSAGNAIIPGVIEQGRWDAFKDGKLTNKGKSAVVGKAQTLIDIDRALLERVINAEIVLVSPLRRAMATAIIFLAKAKQLISSYENSAGWIGEQHFVPDGFGEDHLPKIMVNADLREKYGTESDKPGADGKEDAMEYVRGIAEACGNRWFLNKNALDKTVAQLNKSYRAERKRTHGWLPDPEDGYQFRQQIMNFKTYLDGIVPQSVFIVGHNAWSRFAFASFMPVAGTEDIGRNMRFGTRKVLTLRNVGLIKAQFEDGVFSRVSIDPGDVSGSDPKYALLVSREEALAQRVVPVGAYFDQILISREKTFMRKASSSRYKRLILTFASTSLGIKTVSWTDKFGAIKDAEDSSFQIGHNLFVRQTKLTPKEATFDLKITNIHDTHMLILKSFNFMLPADDVPRLQALLETYGGHLQLLS
mmetsp:Transcript_71990/g.139101  ORF Transcript_71990/g.139101 Transcript_71990/m.139101 type:complete len:482 (-) Transcript_71990:26-1471(-)